ncbi:MAG: biotin--[acetyl-CoA-carboxylase] ligase [Flavobacteriales bacterium CG_4_10_14_0_2_um_filter_32_8]|nr:MAG: biotin--[acetyl-CoA-carboxylase] ligase [Flavobacteriales bacterium CG_4_10_14_0_2_um_filter_32_8]PJB14968.1 MAG: biotin--[acetyl-CoA-carboxylase] ligase [Flavobacteriales bacterium CG_4_9_14_3_um_filter_32_8]
MYQRLVIGNKIIKLEEVDSTNNYMQQLILNQQNEIEGLVVTTKNQTSGKGLGGNVWHSEKDKNLTFSILLKPNCSIQNQFLISKAISLGVLDFLNDLGLKNVKIKWPNDMYIADKKIAGILIENSVRNGSIYSSVVGIGLNVNQTDFKSNINFATSIYNEMGKEYFQLDELLKQLLFFIERRYILLKTEKVNVINQDYLKHLYWINELRNFKTKNGAFKGSIVGINSIGKLQIKKSNSINEFDLKEIEFCY